MTDWSYFKQDVLETVRRLEDRVGEFLDSLLVRVTHALERVNVSHATAIHLEGGQMAPPVDERQAFLDRAALEFFALNRSVSIAYDHAERLWEERERRRGQPSKLQGAMGPAACPEDAPDPAQAPSTTGVVTYPLSVLDDLGDEPTHG